MDVRGREGENKGRWRGKSERERASERERRARQEWWQPERHLAPCISLGSSKLHTIEQRGESNPEHLFVLLEEKRLWRDSYPCNENNEDEYKQRTNLQM